MVALVVFDVALLAYAADGALLIRLRQRAEQRDASVALAESRLERLRAAGCPAAAIGDSLVAPGIHEWWRVTETASGASGPLRAVQDSVAFGTSAAPAAVVLRTSIAC